MRTEQYDDDQFIETLKYLSAKDLYSAATAKEVAYTLQCHPNTAKQRLNELVESKQIEGLMHGMTFFYWIENHD